jgi:hypothetical protein
MRTRHAILSIVAILVTSACGADPVQISPTEASQHKIFDHIRIYGLPSNRVEPFGARLTLEVNEEGRIDKACVHSRSNEDSCLPLNRWLLRDIRYRPFFRNGKAVSVKFYAEAQLLPPERKSYINVTFPATDLGSVKIHLWRGSCFGSCPAYDVNIDGSGNVTWQGHLNTILEGERHGKITTAAVQKLVDMFAAANFLSLDDRYEASITDGPTYALTFSMAGHSKTVTDYIGLAVGMPKAVVDLEEAIDRVAGTERWVRGTTETVEILKKEGFDFTSERARDILLGSLDRPAFLKALIAAGVPVSRVRTGGKGGPHPNPLVVAIGSSDRKVISILTDAGAAKGLTALEAGQMLEAAAGAADPQLIRMVLELGPNSLFTAEAKLNALRAATLSSRTPFPRNDSTFDKQGAIAVLLDTGADPNRLDERGELITEWMFEPQYIAQLVGAGANPNQKNKNGQIALLSNHSEEGTLYLMQVTKPGIADPAIAHALRERAKVFKFAKVLEKMSGYH